MVNPILKELVNVMTGEAMTEWYIQPSTDNDSLSHESSVCPEASHYLTRVEQHVHMVV